MASLTERYNNPGALRPNKIMFEGQVDVDDKGFAIFATPEAGRQALINQINLDIKRGRNTVDSFLEKYTPPSEENPPEARNNYRVFLAEQLGLNSTKEPFPKNSTEKLADAIAKFESGRFGPKEPEESTEDAGAGDGASKDAKVMGDLEAAAMKALTEYPTGARAALDVGAAMLGAGISSKGQAGVRQAEMDARRMAAQDRMRARAAPPAPPPAPTVVEPQKPLSSGAANWTRAMGREIPDVLAEQAESMRKTDPRGGQAIIDRDIKNMERIRGMGHGGFQLSGTGQSQLMLPPEAAQARAAEALKAQQAALQAQQPKPPSVFSRTMSGLSQSASNVGRGINVGTRAFPGVTGALSGLGAAELGQEAYKRSQEGDDLGKYIAGTGAVASGLSALPFAPTRIGGGAIAAASPLVLYLYDKMRKQSQQPQSIYQGQTAPLAYMQQ